MKKVIVFILTVAFTQMSIFPNKAIAMTMVPSAETECVIPQTNELDPTAPDPALQAMQAAALAMNPAVAAAAAFVTEPVEVPVVVEPEIDITDTTDTEEADETDMEDTVEIAETDVEVEEEEPIEVAETDVDPCLEEETVVMEAPTDAVTVGFVTEVEITDTTDNNETIEMPMGMVS